MRGGLHALPRPFGRSRRHGWPRVRLLAVGLALLVLGYAIWPYLVLWRLDRALASDDREVLAQLIDLEAVRSQIARRLDKDSGSTLETASDAFVEWLAQGLKRDGLAVLERRVTLDWVRSLLVGRSPPGQGLGPVVTRAFFDDPLHFSVRLGRQGHGAVRLRLSFDGLRWRVTDLYH